MLSVGGTLKPIPHPEDVLGPLVAGKLTIILHEVI